MLSFVIIWQSKIWISEERGFKSFQSILQVIVTGDINYWSAFVFGNKTWLHVIWYDWQNQELEICFFFSLPLSLSKSRFLFSFIPDKLI